MRETEAATGRGLPRASPGGLEHSFDPTRVVGVVELRGNALCASAVNRRAWGDDLHHRDVLVTWVIADNATLANGLATALFLTDRRG